MQIPHPPVITTGRGKCNFKDKKNKEKWNKKPKGPVNFLLSAVCTPGFPTSRKPTLAWQRMVHGVFYRASAKRSPEALTYPSQTIQTPIQTPILEPLNSSREEKSLPGRRKQCTEKVKSSCSESPSW